MEGLEDDEEQLFVSIRVVATRTQTPNPTPTPILSWLRSMGSKTDAKADEGHDDTKPDAELGDKVDVDIGSCVNAKYDVEPDEAPDENQANNVGDDEATTNARFRVGSSGIDESGDSGKEENGVNAIDIADGEPDGHVNDDEHIMGM
ncbi:hypothetical protein JG688_00014286 [Phytophthora aleatoria]|uniref:Uncharacterized protein n=1 Tax=Phytophthora aleatoria TaxID=2496075 RepID=A0A8J5IL99_9STRA|nr:hypothetical protein JG688_00014286 [Phytophthora aleatoria]